MSTPSHTPLGRGFDSSLGYFDHENDFWTYRPQTPFSSWHGPCNASEHIRDLWDTDKPAIALADGTYEEEILFRRATEIIEQHPPSDPLFLYCKNSHRGFGCCVACLSLTAKRCLFRCVPHCALPARSARGLATQV